MSLRYTLRRAPSVIGGVGVPAGDPTTFSPLIPFILTHFTSVIGSVFVRKTSLVPLPIR
jgi:hypothetical protein